MIRQPVDLPPIISLELIQISDKTNIPFAPKARKVIEKVKFGFAYDITSSDVNTVNDGGSLELILKYQF